MSLPDSGSRTEFDTGAVRDAAPGKGLPHCIPPIAIRKMASRFEEGAQKYGPGNWMRGIPLSRYQDAIIRHLLQWAEGDTTEDHIAAVLWNAAAAAWTEQQIERGVLPQELNDLPYRVSVNASESEGQILELNSQEDPRLPGDLRSRFEMWQNYLRGLQA